MNLFTLCLTVFFLVAVSTTAQSVQWVHAFGSACCNDYIKRIVTDSSGNLYVVGMLSGEGQIGPFAFSSTGFVLKLDSNGTLLWMETAWTSEYSDILIDESEDALYVVGVLANGASVVSYALDGRIKWIATLDSNAFPSRIIPDGHGGLYITGATYTRNSQTAAVWKIDADGEEHWTRNLYLSNPTPGQPNRWQGRGATVDTKGNLVIAAGHFHPNQDFRLVKFDTSGRTLWERTIRGLAAAEDLVSDSSGNLFVAANFFHSLNVENGPVLDAVDGSTSGAIVKFDSEGLFLDAMVIGNGIEQTQIQDLSIAESGDLYVTGYSKGEISIGNTRMSTPTRSAIVMKLDTNLEPNWLWNPAVRPNVQSEGIGIEERNGDIYITGQLNTLAGTIQFGGKSISTLGYDIYVAKLDASVADENTVTSVRPQRPIDKPEVTVAPNPSADFATISCKDGLRDVQIHDNAGRLVLQRSLNGLASATLDLHDLTAGTYWISILGPYGRSIQRLTVY